MTTVQRSKYTGGPPTLNDRIQGFIGPLILMTICLYHHTLALLTALIHLDIPTLTSVTRFRDQAFTRFWNANGASLAAEMPVPLLPLLSSLSGVVLDIGPGSGEQLHRYSASAPAVAYMYGAEPAVGLHERLRAKAEQAGLGSKYRVLACGAQPESLIPALAKEGVLRDGRGGEGVFDAIVSVRVLCGVPRLQETVAGLYGLLKPGGRLVVCEHVVNPWRVEGGSLAARVLQTVYMLVGWKFWMGGCCLDRDTERAVREVAGKEGGEWESVKLETVNKWSTVPTLVGVAVKKS
ncbi:hypothetical protein M501DRAFT_999712 [Patellaria atrata CBS 101060]|uniref:S-adenosyl-L-methionine-dependent methyltransferase n=1 Tax=Patellaria atrata CBS 101060 TaxID=1346257 RepID=A0A9P4VJ92_9PEZI|nr:hypothetical protein M501DRAFT_999712 [Patellaria atrata CBS 101060]